MVIDVAFKQFLVIPEWMEARHFDTCLSQNLFASLPDSFVGAHAEPSPHASTH